MREEPPFSWKTGLKHAGLAVLFVVLLGLAALFLTYDHVQDPEKLGEGVGRFAAFSGMLAIGVSWAWQTGRARLAKGLLVGWVLLVLGTAAAVTSVLMQR